MASTPAQDFPPWSFSSSEALHLHCKKRTGAPSKGDFAPEEIGPPLLTSARQIGVQPRKSLRQLSSSLMGVFSLSGILPLPLHGKAVCPQKGYPVLGRSRPAPSHLNRADRRAIAREPSSPAKGPGDSPPSDLKYSPVLSPFYPSRRNSPIPAARQGGIPLKKGSCANRADGPALALGCSTKRPRRLSSTGSGFFPPPETPPPPQRALTVTFFMRREPSPHLGKGLSAAL